jgi:hypothetical protein
MWLHYLDHIYCKILLLWQISKNILNWCLEASNIFLKKIQNVY